MYSSLTIGLWGCVGRVLAWLPLNSSSSCLWLMCVTHSDVLMPLYRLSDFLMASSLAVTFVVNKVLEIRGCWKLSQGRVEAQQESELICPLWVPALHTPPLPAALSSCWWVCILQVSSSGKQETLFFGVLNFFSSSPSLPSPPFPLSCPLLYSFFPHPSLLLIFLLLPPHLSPSCITGWAETYYVTNNELLIFLYFRRCVLPWLIHVVLGVETRVCVW